MNPTGIDQSQNTVGPRRSSRIPRPSQTWVPENFKERKQQKNINADKDKEHRRVNHADYNLQIFLDEEDMEEINQVYGSNENIKKNNLGFPPVFEFHHDEVDPQVLQIYNELANTSYEIHKAKHASKHPDTVESQESSFRKMIKNALLPPFQQHTEFIRRKYYNKKIYFDMQDLNDNLKLRLINEGIGSQGKFLKFILSHPRIKEGLHTFPQQNITPDIKQQILYANKLSLLISIILTNLPRLFILNQGNYINIIFRHTDVIKYLQFFGAFALLYFTRVNLDEIHSYNRLNELFNLFTQFFESEFENLKIYQFITNEFNQHYHEVQSWMNPFFADVLTKRFETTSLRNIILNLDFDDLDALRYALNDIGQDVGHAILQLNRQRYFVNPIATLDTEIPAVFPLHEMHEYNDDTNDDRVTRFKRIPTRQMIDKTNHPIGKKSISRGIKSLRQQYSWNDIPVTKANRPKNPLKSTKVKLLTVKKVKNLLSDPKDPKKKFYGGSKELKELKKLINKKEKESYKNFKLINKLQIKLKKIVEKLLELNKKYKEVQKKYKKTKNKKDKKRMDTVLKNIKKEKNNKIKLRKDISKNKKESKKILKELKKLDKIKKKNEKNQDTSAKKK